MKKQNQKQVAVSAVGDVILDKVMIGKIAQSFGKRLSDAMAVQTDANTWQLQIDDAEQANVKFAGQKVFIVGKQLRKVFDMSSKFDLRQIVDIIDNSYYNVISNSSNSNKVAAIIAKPPQPQPPKGDTIMPTIIQYSVNVPKFRESLKKNGWTEKKGVYSKGEMNLAFTKTQCRLSNDGVAQNVVLATCTDGQLVKVIKSMQAKTVLKFEPIKDLSEPVNTAGTMPKGATDLPGREQTPAIDTKANKAEEKRLAAEAAKAAKAEEKRLAAEKLAAEKAAKPAPARPVNPNGDKKVVFEQLQSAVALVEKSEKEVGAIWRPIAEKYNYSVTNLIADLHKEGVWPDKKDKNGVPFDVDGFTVPAGYKGVYDSEKAAGTQGAGYMVNRASRMFTKLNPAMGKGEGSKGGKADTPTDKKVKAGLSEKDTDRILIEMSRLAKQLKPEDLKSWLETDLTVQSVMAEVETKQTDIIDVQTDDTDDLLNSLL